MKTLGIVVNNIESTFQRDVIVGVQEVARQHGYETRVGTVPHPASDLSALSLDLRGIQGLIVVANMLTHHALQQLIDLGIVISLSSHQALDIPAVMPNNQQGIALLMAHLLEDCARQSPAFIQGDMRQNDGVERQRAFERECLYYQLELPASHLINGNFSADYTRLAMSQFLATRPDFDAIIAADYLMALTAIDALHASGYRVPQDVAVAAFGDSTVAASAGLTTVAADVVELGRRTARQLIGQLNGLTIRGLTLLSTELIPRSTTQR